MNAIEAGDLHAAGELLPLVYDELRRLAAVQMAREKPGQTRDATALVHETYLKLAGAGSFATKSQFFRAAAQAMRRILIDHARAKKAEMRGGDRRRFELSEADRVIIPDPDTLLSIDEALEMLATEDPAAAVRRVVGRGGRRIAWPRTGHRVPRLGVCPGIPVRGFGRRRKFSESLRLFRPGLRLSG